MEGSAHNFFLFVHNKILAMQKEYPERPAVASVQYRHSVPPVRDAEDNLIVPRQLEQLTEPRVEWRAAGLFPIDNFYDEFIRQLKAHFKRAP